MNITFTKQDIADHYSVLQDLWDLSWEKPIDITKEACLKLFPKTFAPDWQINLLLGEKS